MSPKSKIKQPAVTETITDSKTTKIVGKFNSKYKDILKLTELIKKKK